MLFDEDARGQRLGRVVVAHGHRGLQHDGAAVELGGHQVDARAGDLHPVLERLPLRVDARKRRQQRGCTLRMAFGNASRSGAPDEPHEAREAHERDVAREELARQGRGRTRRGSGTRGDRRPASRCRPRAPDRGRRHPRDSRSRQRSSPPGDLRRWRRSSAWRLLPRPEMRTPIAAPGSFIHDTFATGPDLADARRAGLSGS